MSAPKVTIVIPTYNRARFISETLESAMRQTYKDYEVLVVDDGSTDDTAAVVKRVAPGARYVYQENTGIPEVLNVCVREARGEYVHFLGSDDILFPETIERSAAVLDAHPGVGFVHGAALLIDELGRTISVLRPPFAAGDYIRSGREEIGDLLFSNHIVAVTVMARRDCLLEAGLFDARFGLYEDWNLWTKVAKRHDVAYLNDPLTYYRVHFGPAGSVFAKAKPCEIARYRRMHLDEVLEDEVLRGEFSHVRHRVLARHHLVIARRAREVGQNGYARREALLAALWHPFAAPAAFSLAARTLVPARIAAKVRQRLHHDGPQPAVLQEASE
jgi:glycosyltransferase involved in cell wall biosynthesis